MRKLVLTNWEVGKYQTENRYLPDLRLVSTDCYVGNDKVTCSLGTWYRHP